MLYPVSGQVLSQCDPSIFSFTYENVANCTNNQNSSVGLYEQINFVITHSGLGMTGELYDNGIPIGSLDIHYAAPGKRAYYFSTTGLHTITYIASSGYCSNITLTLTVNVVDGDYTCPIVLADVSGHSNCSFPEDSTYFKLVVGAGSGSVQSALWDINGIQYQVNGSEFYHKPLQPGILQATGYATVSLTGGGTCVTPIRIGQNNSLIDCFLGFNNFYSDPRFEIEGSLIEGEAYNIIFKGSEMFPASNHYELLINGASYGTFDDPAYNQILFNMPSPTAGTYEIQLMGTASKECKDALFQTIAIAPLPPVTPDPEACLNCNTFAPQPGQRYWITAWVKEKQPQAVKTYQNSSIQLEFIGSTTSTVSFQPAGELVEGWQRIAGAFTIPAGTLDMNIHLVNTQSASIDNYFDDIRLHPFNGSMKSYVYDPVTLWLTAELDDNNYATFYEYDQEGQLVRIKKETERGVMTIQESRSSNPKKE